MWVELWVWSPSSGATSSSGPRDSPEQQLKHRTICLEKFSLSVAADANLSSYLAAFPPSTTVLKTLVLYASRPYTCKWNPSNSGTNGTENRFSEVSIFQGLNCRLHARQKALLLERCHHFRGVLTVPLYMPLPPVGLNIRSVLGQNSLVIKSTNV